MKKVLVVIWIYVLIYTVYTLSNYFVETNNNRSIYGELRSIYHQGCILPQVEDNYNEVNGNDNGEDKKQILENFNGLMEINQETVGWINIPSTSIDYPVVKAKDNDFYLNYNIYQEPSKAGAIFMDFRNEGLAREKHTILYGHSMRNGSMFGDLWKYKDESFMLQSPIIEFNTLYEEIKWQIFSVYITSVDFYYIETDFSSAKEYGSFLEDIKSRTLFEMDVEISPEDRILTLSTCTYEFDNARLVIHAKRI